ncbi:MAG: family 20 glycosylhydrolase [Clostridia bacterium]|nr:family 20 glycosylhydrolase [Clostridia bacterium]
MIQLRINADSCILDAVKLVAGKLDINAGISGTVINAVKGESLKISSKSGEYTIEYSIIPEFLRGLAICVDGLKRGYIKEINSKRYFESCGAMIDASRNAVFTVDFVKDMLEYMALMGLNMLMLYTEDTYEISKYPMFGFMRGGYTKEEIREIDRHAIKLGIELVPCIQTLAHLNTTLKWSYAKDFRATNNCLMVGKDKTYEFIEEMFKSVTECFTTKKIHIGLDEAGDISFGNTLKNRGYIKPYDLMVEHLQKVYKLTEKYGLEPMMWSDMFYKSGKNGGDYDYTSVIPDNISEVLPENIRLVYWDYCYEDKKVTDLFVKSHKEDLKRECVFAGGIWTWDRLVPSYQKTFDTARSQLKVCKDHNLKTVFATTWNNTSSLINEYSILPGLQMYAENLYNYEVSDEQISYMFEVCTGYRFDDFMAIGIDDFDKKTLNKYKAPASFCVNPSAQHFFNDILLGLYDKALSGYNFKSHYRKCLKKLNSVGDMGKFNDMITQTKILVNILYIKSTIGIELTEAYKNNNTEELSKILKRLKKLYKLYGEYHEISRKIWYSYCKPLGWEGCDIYISIATERVKSAICRVSDYLKGNIDKIEELEAERIYINGQNFPIFETNDFKSIITVCNY